MNAKVLLLVAGVLVGALVGWLTRPEAAEIKLGPIEVEVQGNSPASASSPLTGGQTQHVLLFALVGGAIGLGLGFVVGRRA